MDPIRQLRKLELTILSVEDLRVDRKSVINNHYMVVRPDSIKSYTTGMAAQGNINPTWNQKFLIDMPVHARCITFEVKCKTSMGVKDVGMVRVAVSGFLGGVVPDNCFQFLSFRLRDWEGRRNGVVNFSVRAESQAPDYVLPPVMIPATERADSCGFHMRDSFGASSSSGGGVVTGIPVSFAWNN